MSAKKPIKKIPAKAPAKTTATKSSVELKAKAFAQNFEKEAKVLKNESKEFSSKIGARREVASTEEKMFTIIGIILLIVGIYYMRQFIGGMLLIVIGILFVTGFFLKRKK